MSRAPYFDKNGMKKGPWSKDEDNKLRAYIERYGHWNWHEIPKFAGVSRCGKSCRLRWMNYLRPNIKHGNFTKEEENVIIELHNKIGNKWSKIASKLPGRSDNEIKNYWNTHLSKQAKQDPKMLKATPDETLKSDQPHLNNSPVHKANSEVPNKVEISRVTLPLEMAPFNTCEYPYLTQSSESLSTSTYSSSGDLTSSMLSESDCSSGHLVQPYGYGYDEKFWTEPFLADYDNTGSTEYSSCLNVVNGLTSQPCSQDMIINDDFLWSTMDLYSKYHSQFS